MRWFNEPDPKRGDRKVERHFAFLPITIGLETRWLEFVSVVYEYQPKYVYIGGYIGITSWKKIRFFVEAADD